MKTEKNLGQMVPTIKVVSAGCNMRCRYCYYRQRNQCEIKIMEEKILRAVITKTIEFSDDDPVVFVWHGGEPLLAGIDFYKKVVSIEEEVRQGRNVNNYLQTNLTLVSKKWAYFFAKHNFNIGVSIDGPQEIHDYCRLFRNGRGSFQSAVRGLKELQGAGLRPGAIALISRICVGYEEEIFNFFVDTGINKFLLKPCYEIDPLAKKPTDYSISPEDYAQFMIKIMEIWLEKDDPNISIRNLEQIMIKLAGGNPSLCEFSGRCWLFPNVDFDGSVGPCNSFPVNKHSYGNILHRNWKELFNSSGFLHFMDDIGGSRSFCNGCEWMENCHGCCPRYSFSQEKSSWHGNIFCKAKKKLFQRVKHIVK